MGALFNLKKSLTFVKYKIILRINKDSILKPLDKLEINRCIKKIAKFNLVKTKQSCKLIQ